jgi:hypothetical protein
MRSMKMPGRWMSLGSMDPTGTMFSASTMVTFAALAMIGPNALVV